MWRLLFMVLVANFLTTPLVAQTVISFSAGTACGLESNHEHLNFSEDCGYSYKLAIAPTWLPDWKLSFRADATERTQPSWNDGNESNTFVSGPAVTDKDRWFLSDATNGVEFNSGHLSAEFFAGGRLAYTSRTVQLHSEFVSRIPSEKYKFIGGGPITGISTVLSLSPGWTIEGEAEGSLLLGKRENPKESDLKDEPALQGTLGAGVSLVWTPAGSNWRISGGLRATHWIDFVVDKQNVEKKYQDYCSCSSIETAIDRTVFTPFMQVTAPLRWN